MENTDTRGTAFGRVIGRIMEARGGDHRYRDPAGECGVAARPFG